MERHPLINSVAYSELLAANSIAESFTSYILLAGRIHVARVRVAFLGISARFPLHDHRFRQTKRGCGLIIIANLVFWVFVNGKQFDRSE